MGPCHRYVTAGAGGSPVRQPDRDVTRVRRFSPTGAPWSPWFNWRLINCSPIIVIGTLLALWIGWHVSAKHWFTGPKHTIDLPDGVTSADEQALEGT